MQKTLTFGSTFSGVGMFDLGLGRAGLRCVWNCEIDPTCRSVLRRHFPDVQQYEAIQDVTDDAADIDLLVGGWPCQDLSVAGKRAGLAGERSGLFYEFCRVIAAKRPRWFCAENVPGLLSSHDGRDMGAVVSEVGKLGYWVAYRVLNARYFGVAQNRRRVFLVGSLGGPRCGEVLFESDCLPWDFAPRRQARERVAACFTAGAHPGSHNGQDDRKDGRLIVAACLNCGGNDGGFRTEPGEHIIPIDMRQASRGDRMTNNRREGTTGGAPGIGVGEPGDPAFSVSERGQAIFGTARVRRLTPRECERLMGLPDDWTRYRDDDSEISDSKRYQMIGNGGAVPVLTWIGERIMATHTG